MLMSDPVLFADFLDLETTMSRRIYRPVTDPTKLRQTLEEFHMRLNVNNTAVSDSLIHSLLSVCHYCKVTWDSTSTTQLWVTHSSTHFSLSVIIVKSHETQHQQHSCEWLTLPLTSLCLHYCKVILYNSKESYTNFLCGNIKLSGTTKPTD